MYTASLQSIHEYDRATSGSKALILGKLLSAGLPVPPGFLVLTTAYERFLSENHLQTELERLTRAVFPAQPASAELAARTISELFEQATLPAEIETAISDAY